MIDLRLGDCLEILPTLPDKSVDAIITDLPYGTTNCKWDSVIPLDGMWKQVQRICKGVFVTTSAQPFSSALVMSNTDWFRYSLVWNKRLPVGFLDANRKPLRVHEDLLVFSKNGHTYNPQMWQGAPYKKGRKNYTEVYHKFNLMDGVNESGKRYPTSIVEISNANRNKDGHPTQKPIDLYEYLIRTYTNEGDTVLDFCMGSGTTLVACVKTNRNGIGIEREQNYFEIAERRIKEAQMQMTMELI